MITNTSGHRPKLLARCVESVERQLPAGATHKIVQNQSYEAARAAALEMGGIIAFVDDDDVVVNDSLNVCYTALTNSTSHMAFTNQQLVDVDGNNINAQQHSGPIRYADISNHPNVLHHLAMFRPILVTEACSIFQKYQTGLCWLIKAEAALKGGAIHVPIIGYNWTQHDTNMSKSAVETAAMRTHVSALQQEISRWATPRGWDRIPQVLPSEIL